MSVAIAVLDRDLWRANTDNLAIVDPAARRVVAIPRDLWCASLGVRISRVFALAGGARLAAELGALGFPVEGGLCLARSAVARALDGVEVEVPVARRLEFLYPLEPTRPLEEGSKLVVFEPPRERLAGERIHQWLGARRVPGGAGSDLHRIGRQWLFVRALLERGFDFGRCLSDPDRLRVFGADPLPALARVTADWRFEILDCLASRTRRGASVLVERHPLAFRLWHATRRLRDRP
jgi:hypothetical protein